MYPSISDMLKGLFGIHLPLPVQTFGFFVALAFFVSAYFLVKDMKRREKMGWLKGQEHKYWIGKPASTNELVWNFIIGFIIGYKLLFAVIHWGEFSADPQHLILSMEGNFIGGIVLGAILAYLRYQDKKKHQLPKPRQETTVIWPHQRIGDLVVIAAVGGLIGAKIFDSLENWKSYMQDPLESFFSFSGLAYYGGLIVAAFVILWYARKRNIDWWQLADAFAPALMLAYGMGRIGCHMAGDGDWGIYNSAYANNGIGGTIRATQPFQQTLHQYSNYFLSHYGSFENVRHASFLKPGFLDFLPNWLFAYTYPHNVNTDGIPIPGCIGGHCAMLPVPVFPTPLYELAMCLIFFAILWSIRKRLKIPGMLFGIYLIFNGIERFLIELIRVENKYDIFGLHITQAEIISLLLIVAGIILIFWVKKKNKPLSPIPQPVKKTK